jgi:tRNA wybutosine-synthesizing protein 1
VRHCALSLVGEPIFYPRINELLRLLHGRRISSFLVNNGQHPEALAALEPVTQLYISIDAATKETLKAIDRPLFADFWERFQRCLELLRDSGQRTVYRLTLIKGPGGNADALDDYVELILRGQPDFIEVKGVTYCGDSPGSSLTMANVPWHTEVREFCEALSARLAACGRLPAGLTYGLAVEHAHSCFVLLAKSSFRVDGAWHTHIDYERFHDLAAAYYATGARFTALDYAARTPDWAVYGAPEAGFDPGEVRWRRKGDGTVGEAEYVPSESGCG